MRTLSLCSGIGGFELGAKLVNQQLGREAFQLKALCEKNQFCRDRALRPNFPGIPIYEDIRDIPAISGTYDLIVGGLPCFTAGTLIFTESGYKEIEDVAVGEKVLTHEGRWKPVTCIMKRDDAELFFVQGQGVTPTLTTSEHPYFVRKRLRFWNNEIRRYECVMADPDWVKAEDLDRNFFTSLILPPSVEDEHSCDFWRLVGLYLADGWRVARWNRPEGQGRVVICANKDQSEQVSNIIKGAGFHASLMEERTVIKFHISNVSLYRFLKEFGTYAHGKSLPAWVLGLSKEKLQALIEGYLFGDGYTDGNGASHITTVSHKMALSLSMAIQKAFGTVATVRLTAVPPKKEIEGRIVNQRPFYRVTIPVKNQEWRSFVENEYAWKRIKSAHPTDSTGTVYNLSVADDESYIANGAIVHNCQPFSLAGKQKGESDDRNLFPEFFRLLRGIRPAGAIIENVPGLLTANSGQFFRDILWQFTEAGYSVAWDVVSCAEVGGVHRRERIWIIATSNDQSVGRISRTGRDKATGKRDSTSKRCDRKHQNGISSYSNSLQRLQWQRLSEGQERECLPNTIRCGGSSINADSNGKGLEAWECSTSRQATIGEPERSRGCDNRQNETQSGVCSLNDGISDRLVRSHLMTPEELPDRLPYATDSNDIPYRKEMLQSLGNAIVPDVAAIALYKFLEITNLLEDEESIVARNRG